MFQFDVRLGGCTSQLMQLFCRNIRRHPGERLRLQTFHVSQVAFVEAVHGLGDVLNFEQMITRRERLRYQPINLGRKMIVH